MNSPKLQLSKWWWMTSHPWQHAKELLGVDCRRWRTKEQLVSYLFIRRSQQFSSSFSCHQGHAALRWLGRLPQAQNLRTVSAVDFFACSGLFVAPGILAAAIFLALYQLLTASLLRLRHGSCCVCVVAGSCNTQSIVQGHTQPHLYYQIRWFCDRKPCRYGLIAQLSACMAWIFGILRHGWQDLSPG